MTPQGHPGVTALGLTRRKSLIRSAAPYEWFRPLEAERKWHVPIEVVYSCVVGVYFWLCYGVGSIMGVGPLYLLEQLSAQQWQIGEWVFDKFPSHLGPRPESAEAKWETCVTNASETRVRYITPRSHRRRNTVRDVT